jgi:hypothetical protein
VKLARQFKLTNLEQLGWYLGINFTFTKEGVFLFQKPYIEDMLHMCGMAHCNLTKVLMVKGTRLIANMNEQKVDATTYKKNGWQTNIFGVLSHFSFLVLVMSRFLVEP